MSGGQEQLEIKFRLHDGSDIGPKRYPVSTSIATLKQSILSQWPGEKLKCPITVNDLKLISGGKILENDRLLGECRSPIVDLSGGFTTMHVIVCPSLTKRTEKKFLKRPKEQKCGCVIM